MAENKEAESDNNADIPEKKLTLNGSEFAAGHDLDLHYVRNIPCQDNIKGCSHLKLKKGDKIPEIFIPNFLQHNRDFIANLETKDDVILLTPEQEKKYNVAFGRKEPKTKKPKRNYNAERLSQKWGELGGKDFKIWAEKEFGEDKIDRRLSPRQIINEIMSWF